MSFILKLDPARDRAASIAAKHLSVTKTEFIEICVDHFIGSHPGIATLVAIDQEASTPDK